jgi:type II secretory pathway component PulM
MRSLSAREKILLYVLGSVGIGALIYTFIISPLLAPSADKAGSTGSGMERVAKMERLSDEYKKTRQEKVRLQSLLESKGESTTTMIQQWAVSSGIEKNLGTSTRAESVIKDKYQRITIDQKIEGVAFQSLMKFVNEIENSNGLIRLQYIRIRKALKGTDTYDVTLKIDTYTSKK